MGTLDCPDCHYSVVTLARWQWYDYLLVPLFLRRFQCHQCNTKFMRLVLFKG
jgi:hypothetical protein